MNFFSLLTASSVVKVQKQSKLSKNIRDCFWVHNDDGTVSLMVKMKPVVGDKEKAMCMVNEAKKIVMEIGERVAFGTKRVVDCNSFLGFNEERELEAVGMATIQGGDKIEERLSSMKITKLD